MLPNIFEQQIATLNILFQVQIYYQEEIVESNFPFVCNYIFQVLGAPGNCKLILKQGRYLTFDIIVFEQKRFNNISNFCGVFISMAVFQFYGGGKKRDQKNSMFNNSKEKRQIRILKKIEVERTIQLHWLKILFLFIREII